MRFVRKLPQRTPILSARSEYSRNIARPSRASLPWAELLHRLRRNRAHTEYRVPHRLVPARVLVALSLRWAGTFEKDFVG